MMFITFRIFIKSTLSILIILFIMFITFIVFSKILSDGAKGWPQDYSLALQAKAMLKLQRPPA